MDPITFTPHNSTTQPIQQDTNALPYRSVPDDLPTGMPVQDLARWDKAPRMVPATGQWRARQRRALVLAATLALTGGASYEMYQVLNGTGLTVLQMALLIVFTISFIWIALPFVSGLAGFCVLWRSRDKYGIAIPALQSALPLTTRTALLMPVYNETPHRIFAGLQAMYEALDTLGVLDHFDMFILSDTTDPAIWLEEEMGFWDLRRRTGGERHIFYRHRAKNTRRKAGNVADFCQRWGAAYEHMVVLDADSLMSGETLVRLAAAMEAHPDTGLIQTLPLVVNRNTLFARAQQFAARIYGPVIAAGLSCWHLGDSSYWGHNAIIRTQAFIAHAGLPDLPGRPPFGGLILSHDFVEAALLRRAGWNVYLAPALSGSYEESPPSLIDFADRDRRWCQGNLQHIRIVSAKGLYWLSRLHLVTGIMSYLASPIWLLFIILGILLALQSHFLRPEYFPKQFALFPSWPDFDPQRAVRLFVGTVAILLAPKFFGYVLLCKDGHLARRCGGRLRAGVSVLFEIVVSSLLAPVMMVMQSAVVVGILTGRDVGWETQRRDDGSIPLRVIAHRHLPHTLLGLLLAISAYAVAPSLLAWMAPVVLGLVLAIPLSVLTGQQALGRIVRQGRFLVTPEESDPPEVLRRTNELTHEWIARRPQGESNVVERLANNPTLRRLHAAMLTTVPRRHKGEYDVNLLLGLAKLDDAESLEEAAALLTSQEMLAVLSHQSGFDRLSHFITAIDRDQPGTIPRSDNSPMSRVKKG